MGANYKGKKMVVEKVDVVYSKRVEYWIDFGINGQFIDITDFNKVFKDITDVCFISGKGVGFITKRGKQYQFVGLTDELLEQLADGEYFDDMANAKMWYCCLKYALENKECIKFWEKYKDTYAGTKFMAIVLSEKPLENS